jgi:hypothetical protein
MSYTWKENLDVAIPVKITGNVTLNSGYIGAVALTDDAGANIAEVHTGAGDGRSKDTYGIANYSYLISYDKDADKWNRIRVNKSGQGALTVATSGSDYVVTRRATSAVLLASGLATMDTYTYSGAAFTDKNTASVVVDYLGGGSGVSYRVRGHAIQNIAPAIIGSGVVATSGNQGTLTVTGAYQYVEVGVANLQAGFSGAASVILATQ